MSHKFALIHLVTIRWFDVYQSLIRDFIVPSVSSVFVMSQMPQARQGGSRDFFHYHDISNQNTTGTNAYLNMPLFAKFIIVSVQFL